MSEGRAQLWHLYLGTDYRGFKVYHYAAGTTTAKDVWADAGKTTVLANPVVADNNGWVQFFADGEYRFLVKDADGLLIRDLDYVRVTNDQPFVWEGSHGTTLPAADTLNQHHMFVKHSAQGTYQGIYYSDGTQYLPVGATLTGSMLNVLTYGAVGDGATNNAVAFQAALDDAETTGTTLYVPPGEYLIEARLYIGSNTTIWFDPRAIIVRNYNDTDRVFINKNAPPNPRNGQIVGSNQHITIIGGIFRTASTAMHGGWFDFIDVEHLTMRDCRVESYHSNWCIHFIGNYAQFINLVIDNEMRTTDTANPNDDGIHIFGGKQILVEGCFIRTGDDAIAIANSVVAADAGATTYFSIEDVTVTNCVLDTYRARLDIGLNVGPGLVGIPTQHVRGITVSNCVIRKPQNQGWAICVEDSRGGTSAVSDVNISNVSIVPVSPTGRCSMWLNNVERVSLSQVQVVGDDVYGVGFRIDDCNDITLTDCRIPTRVDNGVTAISATDSQGLKIIGGMYAGPVNNTVLSFDGCSRVWIKDATIKGIPDDQVAIELADTDYVTVDGCYFASEGGTAVSNGIVTFTGTSDNATFINNDFTRCSTTFRYAGVIPTATWVENNQGYCTFAQGLATIPSGSAYVDVTHGVKQIMAALVGSVVAQNHRIQVSAVDSCDVYAWAVSNTAIRIQETGGAVGTDKRVSWTIDHRRNFET